MISLECLLLYFSDDTLMGKSEDIVIVKYILLGTKLFKNFKLH